MYILVDETKATGYKGKRLSNDNLSSFPEELLEIWERAGIIKKVVKSKSKKDDGTT